MEDVLNSIISNIYFQYFIGYFFGIFIAHFFISYIINQLWELIQNNQRESSWLPGIVGWIERVLFIIAIQNSAYGFIGIWLALKVAAQWKKWKDKEQNGRIAYNIFIIGSGLSVIFAIVGAKLIDWFKEDIEVSKIVFIPLIVIGFSLFLRWYIKQHITNDLKTQ